MIESALRHLWERRKGRGVIKVASASSVPASRPSALGEHDFKQGKGYASSPDKQLTLADVS